MERIPEGEIGEDGTSTEIVGVGREANRGENGEGRNNERRHWIERA